MTRYLFIFLLFSTTLALSCCQRDGGNAGNTKPLFDSIPALVTVQPIIAEASGIADSKRNPGYLWVQEDGGTRGEIILLKHNGLIEKKIVIDGVFNRDWEDMSLSGNNIYIGEIGDNTSVQTEYRFYKFSEPVVGADTVYNPEVIRFRYPDGPHDAEAFLVEPSSQAIYIITKRENPSRIYKLTPPFSPSISVAVFVGQLTYGGVVSAAISPDNKEIIIKTYVELGYYKVGTGEKIEAVLSKSPTIIPYRAEPQGEAVCFSALNNGYYTLSEKAFASDVKLYFYKRN